MYLKTVTRHLSDLLHIIFELGALLYPKVQPLLSRSYTHSCFRASNLKMKIKLLIILYSLCRLLSSSQGGHVDHGGILTIMRNRVLTILTNFGVLNLNRQFPIPHRARLMDITPSASFARLSVFGDMPCSSARCIMSAGGSGLRIRSRPAQRGSVWNDRVGMAYSQPGQGRKYARPCHTRTACGTLQHGEHKRLADPSGSIPKRTADTTQQHRHHTDEVACQRVTSKAADMSRKGVSASAAIRTQYRTTMEAHIQHAEGSGLHG